MRRRHPDSWPETARLLRGPLYAVVDAGAAYQGGHGWSGSGSPVSVSLSVRHARGEAEVTVETADEPQWPQVEQRLLWEWSSDVTHRLEPVFPVTLTADRWEQDVPVDGSPVRFVVVGGGGSWVAAGEVDGRAVGVSGRGWPAEGLALQSVDPAGLREEH